MSRRRTSGSETWARLREWTSGQGSAERLAAQILLMEGFRSVDPSHPLGGPDGLKDMLCIRENEKWIGAAYFPRGKKTEAAIKKKFSEDLKGVKKNQAEGLAFVTNQELSLSIRQELAGLSEETAVELYHLERLSAILDSPSCYGIRLEYLDIEMTKEEQLAFMAARDRVIEGLQAGVAQIAATVSDKERHAPRYVTPRVALNIASFGAFGPQLYKCSHCGYGYFVNRSLGLLYSLGEMTVTCPGCGNTEKWETP